MHRQRITTSNFVDITCAAILSGVDGLQRQHQRIHIALRVVALYRNAHKQAALVRGDGDFNPKLLLQALRQQCGVHGGNR